MDLNGIFWKMEGKFEFQFGTEVELNLGLNRIWFKFKPNLKKRIFQKTILNLKFKLPAHNIILFWPVILNFKFKIVFWNIFFFEIWRSKK